MTTYLSHWAARDNATCECGHAAYQHREAPYGSAKYRPAVFVCDECDCGGWKEAHDD